MDLSRRDFVRISAGTALGGLVGLGAKLDATTAQAQELRIKPHPACVRIMRSAVAL